MFYRAGCILAVMVTRHVFLCWLHEAERKVRFEIDCIRRSTVAEKRLTGVGLRLQV